MNKNNSKRDNKGLALIVVVLLMFLILSLALYFLSFSLTERRMAGSQEWGVKTYHLAEAGLVEMLWKLKNDSNYRNSFMNDADWTQTITRSDPFGESGTFYEATIVNSDKGKGQITATGTIDIAPGRVGRRVVKSKVFKAIPADGDATSSLDIHESALFAEKEIKISHSDVSINGSLHSNDNIKVNGFGTDVYVSGDVEAVGRITKSFSSEIHAEGTMMDSHNYPPPPEEIDMPPVSFDEEDPDSFRSRADVVYSENGFEDLLDSATGPLVFGTASSSQIVYVTGDIMFDQDLDVTIYGALVAEGDIYVGKGSGFVGLICEGEHTSLDINFIPGHPTGLIAKDNITFGFCLEASTIEGIAYAGRKVNIKNFTDNISVTGGIFGRTIEIFSVWNDMSMTYDEDIVGSTFYTTEYAPVIKVDHWEEEY